MSFTSLAEYACQEYGEGKSQGKLKKNMQEATSIKARRASLLCFISL